LFTLGGRCRDHYSRAAPRLLRIIGVRTGDTEKHTRDALVNDRTKRGRGRGGDDDA